MSSEEKLPVPIVRTLEDGDVGLIYDSWLKSYKGANDRHESGLPDWIYFDHYRGIIDQLLARAEIAVLCDLNDTDFIYGWLCYELPGPFGVIHYVFVKKDYRRLGFATKLIVESGLQLEAMVYTFSKYSHLAAEKFETTTYTPVERWLA